MGPIGNRAGDHICDSRYGSRFLFKNNMKINLEEFLALHNRLSPSDFQATMEMLVRFRDENIHLFNGDVSAEKIRRPFLDWLCESFKKSTVKSSKKGGWVTFPRPSN